MLLIKTAGIETSEAETMGPAEPIPTNPNDYTPMTGPTPEEISSSESHEAVEYMAEGGTYTHTTGKLYSRFFTGRLWSSRILRKRLGR